MKYPTLFTWDGCVMVPRSLKLAQSRFTVAGDYLLAEVQDRSVKSHDHEFAWLAEAWKSLPEHMADPYPTADHLRKRALVQAGFYDETITDAGSNAAALRMAATIRAREEFALVFVRGAFVIIRDPKSQARGAMDREEFQRSKTAIMEIVAEMLGVPVASIPKTEAA